jgi:hypothetical protein
VETDPFVLGIDAYNRGAYSDAVSWLRLELERKPDHVLAAIALGRFYVQLKAYVRGREACT